VTITESRLRCACPHDRWHDRSAVRVPDSDQRFPGPAPSWNATQRVAATLLLAMHAVLAWRLRVPGLTTGHDDAMYLSLARALRSFSYAELAIVGLPTHSMYPPLYPLLLAVLGIDGPQDITVGVTLNIALSVLALGLAARLAGRITPWHAVAMLVVCAPNPLLLDRASSISSEPLFMATTFLALLLLAGGERSMRTLAIGAGAVIVATLTRSIGIALLVATLVHWLLGKQWRRAGTLALAAALSTGAWLAWTVRAPRLEAGRSYIADAVYPGATRATTTPATTASPSSTAVSPAVSPSLVRIVAERVSRTVPAYLSRDIPEAMAMPMFPGTPADNVAWTALLLGGGLTGLLLLAGAFRHALLYLVAYLAVLAAWPYVLQRFVAPVLPLLVLVMFVGLGWMAERMAGAGLRRIVVGGVAVLIALGALRRDATAVRALSACDRRAPTTSAACFDEEQRDFFAAAALARRVTPDSARFLSSKEATLYLLTGRQSVRQAQALTMRSPDEFARFLQRQGVGYILLSRLHLDQWSLWRTLTVNCRDYAVVQAFGAHVALLRVRAPEERAGGDDSDGCAAIERWGSGDWES